MKGTFYLADGFIFIKTSKSGAYLFTMVTSKGHGGYIVFTEQVVFVSKKVMNCIFYFAEMAVVW